MPIAIDANDISAADALRYSRDSPAKYWRIGAIDFIAEILSRTIRHARLHC